MSTPTALPPSNEYEIMIGPSGAQWSVGEMVESKRFGFPKLVRQRMRDALAAQMLTMGLPRLETSKQGDFLGAALAASGYNAYNGSEAVKKIWKGKVNNFLVNSLKNVKAEALERLRAQVLAAGSAQAASGIPGVGTAAQPVGTAPPSVMEGVETERTAAVEAAPPGIPAIVTPTFTPVNANGGSFTPVNSGGFTPVNGGFTPVNKRSRDGTPIVPAPKDIKEGLKSSGSDPWRQLEDQVLLEQLEAAVVAILQRGSSDAQRRAEKIIIERFGAQSAPAMSFSSSHS